MAHVIIDLSHPEQLIRKPQVGGSIPLAGSRNIHRLRISCLLMFTVLCQNCAMRLLD
jgi:hypothetical protein